MVPMPSTNSSLNDEQKRLLRQLALQSIEHGLHHHTPLPLALGDYSGALMEPGASFVTLEKHGELRGCIGSLQAHRPLVEDVVENAFSAAFRDPRFAPVSDYELEGLSLHISLLSKPEPFPVQDEADLLHQLKPGVDGLILQDGVHRATFLPSVWESLPQPAQFLHHLKLKAGLPAQYWSDTLKFQRYYTEVI